MSEITAAQAKRTAQKDRAAPEIVVPRCDKGRGFIVSEPESADLIDGVSVEPFKLFPDDRGCFLEVARGGSGLIAHFPAATTQVSAALSYPGTIKAFHYHRLQSDCWVPVTGMLQVALADLRKGSRTFGVRNTMFVGAMRPWRILIPPGVAHGYKVIGAEASILVYVTDRFYDPTDEGRIAYNDPGIQYDWEIQHK